MTKNYKAAPLPFIGQKRLFLKDFKAMLAEIEGDGEGWSIVDVFGGSGTVYGTTKTKGTPNLPTKARVVLLHQRSKLPVRETWSDPVTGAFVFGGIDTSQQFLALAEDAEGHFRAVAANRLTPEVL